MLLYEKSEVTAGNFIRCPLNYSTPQLFWTYLRRCRRYVQNDSSVDIDTCRAPQQMNGDSTYASDCILILTLAIQWLAKCCRLRWIMSIATSNRWILLFTETLEILLNTCGRVLAESDCVLVRGMFSLHSPGPFEVDDNMDWSKYISIFANHVHPYTGYFSWVSSSMKMWRFIQDRYTWVVRRAWGTIFLWLQNSLVLNPIEYLCHHLDRVILSWIL